MKKLIVITASILIGIYLPAQYYYYDDRYYDQPLLIETGIAIGFMNSLTDIGGKKGTGDRFLKDLNWKNTKPCAGFYIMANYQYALGIRFETMIGSTPVVNTNICPEEYLLPPISTLPFTIYIPRSV